MLDFQDQDYIFKSLQVETETETTNLRPKLRQKFGTETQNCGYVFNTETKTRYILYPNVIGNEHFSLIESHKNDNSACILFSQTSTLRLENFNDVETDTVHSQSC